MVSALELLDFLRKGLMTDFASDEELHGMCMETPKLRTLSVLLVNDALEEREEYARILRISGYRAVEAATFAAAYQIATKNSVDIVVTDVRIGGSISGLELTRRLRNDTRTAAVPIIVLTTVSRPQDGDIAIKAGADIFLEKPVPVPVLKAEIVRLLRLPLLISQSVQTRQPSSGRSKPETLTRSSKPKVDTARNRTYVRDNLHRRPIRSHAGFDVDSPCPWCGATLEFRARCPILAVQTETPPNGDRRERLQYAAGWFCTNPSCDYGELS